MKHIIHGIFSRLAVVSMVMLATLTACRDDFDFGGTDEIGEGTANVSLSVSFTPMTSVELSSRTSGTALDDFADVWVLMYSTEGELQDKYYFAKSDFVSYEYVTDDPDAVYDTMAEAVLPSISIPYGKYHIYAVANMGSGFDVDGKNEDEFRKIQLTWNATNVAANNQMAGYFDVVTGKDAKSAKTYAEKNYASNHECVINKSVMYLHSWMRRNATKVTIAYDASQLRENIWIYIKSATLRCGADNVTLIDNFTANEGADTVAVADKITYSTQTDYLQWLMVAKGSPTYGSHTTDGKALYCFENMQGNSEDQKPQEPVTEGSSTLTQEIKDDMPYGTYIEVEAYYVSNATGNEGKGPIKYRFMLGKDVTYNCDVERNYHLMLTLNFVGNANEVDWHIDYKEEKSPGIYLPETYYISYLYNQSMEYPVRIELGEKEEFTKDYIEATITLNYWGPVDASDDPNAYKPTLPTETEEFELYTEEGWRQGLWNGFLSLYKDSRTSFNTGYSFYTNWNELDWYGYNDGSSSDYGDGSGNSTNLPIEAYSDRTVPHTMYVYTESSHGSELTANHKDQGYRRYAVPKENGTFYYKADLVESNANDDYVYRVVRSGREETFYLPMYTRPLIMTTTSGYSGNNTYTSFRRKARVKISAEINHSVQEDSSTIYQVRRQINPKGVYRKNTNVRPFTVTLMRREGESKTDEFVTFTSVGPWKAEITQGSGWAIVGRSSGSSGSQISLTVAPISKIGEKETRCAILDIRYHNYTCHHIVILRQGYAPMQMTSSGAYWHSYNLWYSGKEVESPLDEGSMFLHASYDYPIDAINNTLHDFNQVAPYNSKGTETTYDGYYIVAPLTPGSTPTMASWTSSTYKESGEITGSFNSQTINNVTCRVAKLEDFVTLRDRDVMEIGYGVCYGDGASTTQHELNRVFRNAWYKRQKASLAANYNYYGRGAWDASTKEGEWGSDLNDINGIRGCFVYRKDTGANIFFPIGQSGYGHRMHSANPSGKTGYGWLRYAGGANLITNANVIYRPPFYSIYTNMGAIYWLQQKDFYEEDVSKGNGQTAWDINYSTFDFNGYNTDATNGKYKSAAYIRLVQDTAP
ncbi:MAG: hypothetical protein LUD17_16225 [Bacteroidales bacterium]|nr:hypothetical protein [Bacteroidales bacterium]